MWLVKSYLLSVLEPFRLSKARSWRFNIWGASSLNSGGSVLPTLDGVMVSNGGNFFNLYGRENPCDYFNWRYKYPFEPVCLFNFTLKSSYAHILSSVKLSAKLTSLFSIKSLSKELFLISISFLLSLIHIFSLLSFFSFYSFLSFVPP